MVSEEFPDLTYVPPSQSSPPGYIFPHILVLKGLDNESIRKLILVAPGPGFLAYFLQNQLISCKIESFWLFMIKKTGEKDPSEMLRP